MCRGRSVTQDSHRPLSSIGLRGVAQTWIQVKEIASSDIKISALIKYLSLKSIQSQGVLGFWGFGEPGWVEVVSKLLVKFSS